MKKNKCTLFLKVGSINYVELIFEPLARRSQLI